MTEQPVNVAREARSIHQSLKELLKSKEPFDKEVDFQRKNLRRRYLQLLLVHPDARESKDVENHLWMQTSYAFIASYKQRIAALDRVIQNNQRHQQPQQGQQPPRQNNHGVVEHRKLVSRFVQFLGDEEKFWTQLLLRLRRLFDLGEAQPALVALGLLSETDDSSVANLAGMHGAGGRNHHQFPPEDPTLTFVPTTSAERDGCLAILSKALICLGDIARYKELYIEKNGRRAGHEDGPARRGRNRRGELPPRPRNYDKARQCYEQARLLVPYEGNPSHQLAILSSYQKDSFSSLIHYYRALCVSQPYDTAAENLGTVLTKALDMWRQRTRRERDKNGTNDIQLPPRVRVEIFKERMVVLHALWRVGMDKGIEKMKSISPKHNEKVFHDFYALVSERHLPIDMISNTIVLTHGALWKHRMIRDTLPRKTDSTSPVQAGTSTLIEWGLLDHLMDMHLVLLEVGKDELKDPPPMDGATDDLAQRISATFRRTLPALRIASKWLRANFKYVVQDQEFIAYQTRESETKGVEVNKKVQHKISGYSTKTLRFWKTYAQFMLALSQAFPTNKLPVFSAPLEEDIEMKGFLPLKKLMGEEKRGEAVINGGFAREQVHPNVEQLMRISDLLDDAKALVKMENSPLLLINNHLVFNPEIVEDVRPVLHPAMVRVIEDDPRRQVDRDMDYEMNMDSNSKPDSDVDDMGELASHTDDDPVGDIFVEVQNGFSRLVEDELDQEDEEDDEIVWDPRGIISPALSPTLNAKTSPVTPVKPLLSPKALSLSPRSPTHYQPLKPVFIPPPPATTAQDLLNDVMGLGIASRALGGGGNLGQHAESMSTALQPPFLFGSELPHRPSHSIWSASSDEQQLRYTGNGNGNNLNGGIHGGQIYQTSPPARHFAIAPVSQSQDLSQQSIWSNSYPSQGSTQNSQQNSLGIHPSGTFAAAPQPNGSIAHRQNQHQRMPSAAVASQLLSGQQVQHQLQSDPFGYPTAATSLPMPQPPIHRPEHMSSNSAGYLHSQLAQGAFGGPAEYYTSTNANSSSGYHSRQLSMHDPRVVVGGQQAYGVSSAPLSMPMSMSQVWGNAG